MGILDEFDMKRHLNVVLPASSIWHSSGHDVDSIAFSRAIRLGSAPILLAIVTFLALVFFQSPFIIIIFALLCSHQIIMTSSAK